ncbi:MAG: H-type small acid-soluble spore protein [Clostridia bacterium]|nr:H-type small acid-soluble spore protein [Clostridia bacterium]
MNRDRAQQIVNSYGVIEVLYNGSPVWIEGVKDNSHAEVSYLNSRDKKMDVALNDLIETNTAF